MTTVATVATRLTRLEARRPDALSTPAFEQYRDDPVGFARLAGIDPDPWQSQLLQSKAKQQILLCARQTGKSTTVAAKASHTALYRPGSLILTLAPALRQSQELYRK